MAQEIIQLDTETQSLSLLNAQLLISLPQETADEDQIMLFANVYSKRLIRKIWTCFLLGLCSQGAWADDVLWDGTFTITACRDKNADTSSPIKLSYSNGGLRFTCMIENGVSKGGSASCVDKNPSRLDDNYWDSSINKNLFANALSVRYVSNDMLCITSIRFQYGPTGRTKIEEGVIMDFDVREFVDSCNLVRNAGKKSDSEVWGKRNSMGELRRIPEESYGFWMGTKSSSNADDVEIHMPSGYERMAVDAAVEDRSKLILEGYIARVDHSDGSVGTCYNDLQMN